MDSVVFAHHGKMIAFTVRKMFFFSNEDLIERLLFSFVAFSVGCTCKNGGRCIMGLGTYICECPYGYNGLNCETSKLLSKIGIRTLV
jgi:hypothetical protein